MQEKGGVKTTFGDAVVPVDKELGGDWGATHDGCDVQGGQKGTKGKIPEVTYVDVQGAPREGSSATAGAGPIAGKGRKDIGGY